MSMLILCLFLLLSLCNCGKIFEISNTMTNKYEFEVKKGEEFALKFESNPSTGFSWHFLNLDEVNDSLELLRTSFEGPNDPKIRGKGGYMYFHFKAIEVTKEAKQLQFSYYRSTNSNSALYKQVVKINVF